MLVRLRRLSVNLKKRHTLVIKTCTQKCDVKVIVVVLSNCMLLIKTQRLKQRTSHNLYVDPLNTFIS